MASDPDAGPLRFGPFALDPANALLTRGSERIELPPKAFAVLCHLAQRPGALVTKDELLDAVWGRRFVSESVLKTAVNAIRAALSDDAREPRFVETVSRRGYRFIGVLGASAPASAASTRAATPVADTPANDEPEAPPGPWVARDAALARLLEWLVGVRAGGRLLGLVGGEAGIGKTALIERFRAAARAADAMLAGGQCIEQPGGGEPFLPVLDALADLAHGPHGPAWSEALRERAPSWQARLPWLASPDAPAPGAPEPERMLREFGALLDAATRERPLLLVLEDLHWSDHATVQLLGYLARRRGTARWMVLGSFRPTDAALADHPLQALRHELRAQRLASELVLDAFSERDVDAYLERRFAPAPVEQRQAFARRLHEHTEGLPLFVAHVVDDLVATGLLSGGAPGWALVPDAWARLEVPETIAGLVERQISRLPGEWRALLEAAAVAGQEFAHDVLARIVETPPEALRARLDGLARSAEWLASAGMAERADGSIAFRYAFRHALYQRVFHDRAEPPQRLQQHLAAARALEAIAPHPAELAQHHEQAFRTAAAAGLRASGLGAAARRWRFAAARDALGVHALADAQAQVERLLELDPTPADRARALELRSELRRLGGRGDLALADGEAALADARASGDAALRREIGLAFARLCVRCDRVPEGLARADALLAGGGLDDAARRSALLVTAEAQRQLGAHDAAEAALRAALELVPADDLATRADVVAERVAGCFHRGAPAEGLALAQEARSLYERCGRPAMAARMLIRVGVFAQALDRRDEAEPALLEGRARMQRLGDVDGERGAILNLAKLYSDAGDAARALPLLEQGWALADGFESPVAEAAFLQGFYYCRLLGGDLGRALADAQRVLASAEALHSLYWKIGAAALVSDLYIHLGDTALAARLLDGALAAMPPGGEQALRARVLLRRAWVDVVDGDPGGALARIAALRAEGRAEPAEDAVNLDRVEALARLAQGDAAGALAAIAARDGAPTLEAWALLLALRLDVRRALGAGDAADIARASEEVRGPRLPALEGLVLRRALAEALAAAGHAQQAKAERQALEAERQRLAASLDALPPSREAFLARF